MTRFEKTDRSHKAAELLRLASFYQQTQPNVRTLDLLKAMGFKIAGLARRFRGSLPCPRPHVFVWNPTLQWGVCLCGKWEERGMEETRARKRQQMHARLEAGRPLKERETLTFLSPVTSSVPSLCDNSLLIAS